jgi:tetratricopeptide (TPR) repeat protein
MQAYKQVAEYQVAETTTAATYETAELYRTLAQDLLSSERPKKLSADALEQYDSLLEEQAFPFEEQSIAIHELNAKRTPDGVYDESIRRSLQALAQLKPARYGKIERSESWVATLAAPAGGAAPSSEALSDYEHMAQLAASGKEADAELQKQLQQFEQQHPGFPATAIDLGLLTRRLGQLPDSEKLLRRAVEIDPGSAMAWSELGVTLRQEGRFVDARAAYAKALECDPAYAPAHRNLGVLLDIYLAEPVAALPEFERYQQLSGEDKPVSTWIAELRTRTGVKAAPAPEGAPAATDAPVGAAAPHALAAGERGDTT